MREAEDSRMKLEEGNIFTFLEDHYFGKECILQAFAFIHQARVNYTKEGTLRWDPENGVFISKGTTWTISKILPNGWVLFSHENGHHFLEGRYVQLLRDYTVSMTKPL